MADNRPRWIDSDMHLAEPPTLWEAYVDPRYRDELARWTGIGPGFSSLRQGPAPSINAIREQRAHVFEPYLSPDGSCIDPPGQLRAMDTEGIEIAVLFPTVGARGWQSAPADIAMALARAYNEWLYDFCQYDPHRLKLNALIPLLDVDAAVAEIRRVAKRGAVSIFPGSTRPEVRLDDPAYEPIWAEAEESNLAVDFHGLNGFNRGPMVERYRDKPTMAFTHAAGRPVEHMLSFMELLFSGVLERHPGLRIAFLEAGASWVPYWLFRLEEEWKRFRGTDPELAQNVTMRPIAYWRRQCYCAVEIEEWPLRMVIELIGDDNLVVSSDFPHFDSAFPEAFHSFMQLAGVSADSKRKILWDNCAGLYDLG